MNTSICTEDLWSTLKYVRHYIDEEKDRDRILSEIYSQIKKSLHSNLLNEIDKKIHLSLYEFILFELNGGMNEAYRLEYGITILDELFIKNLISVENSLNYIDEILLYFIVGEKIQENRVDVLKKISNSINIFTKRLSNNLEFYHNINAKSYLILGEAFKEQAMITPNEDLYIEYIDLSKMHLNKCISTIKNYTNLTNLSKEDTFLLGCSYRHLSVVYELYGDLEKNKDKRISFYKRWYKYSYIGKTFLTKINEHRTRAYCIMNGISAQNRLYEVTENIHYLTYDKDEYIYAKNIFKVSKDFRGLGWLHIHNCENIKHQIELSSELLLESLYQEVEYEANNAIASAKHTEDHLLIGLSYVELAIALYESCKNLNCDITYNIKIHKSISCSKMAISSLKNTGYFNALSNAYYFLAKCYNLLYKIDNQRNAHYLDLSIKTLTESINMYTSQSSSIIKESIYNDLINLLKLKVLT